MDEHCSAGDLHSKLPQKQRTRFGHSKLPQTDLYTALSSSDPSTFLLMLTIAPFLVCLTAILFLCEIPPSSTAGEDKEEARYFGIINADLKTQSRRRFWKSIATMHCRVRISDISSFLSWRWFGAHIWTLMDMAVIPDIMIRRFPEVRSVKLKGKPHFADYNLLREGWGGYVYPWIVAMARAYPWLEEIRLKCMVVTDESLELILKSFNNFKVLVFSSCEGFTTDGLAAIVANCR